MPQTGSGSPDKSRGVMKMSGFLSGSFWGLVMSGVAVAGASLVTPPPQLEPLETAAPAALPAAPVDPQVAVPETAQSPDAADPPAAVIETVTKVPTVAPPAGLAPPAAPEADVAGVDVSPPPEPEAVPEETVADLPTPEASSSAAGDTLSAGTAPAIGLTAPVTPEVSQDAVTATTSTPDPVTDTTSPAPATFALDPVDTAPDTAPAIPPDIAATVALPEPPATPQAGVVIATSDAPVVPNPQSQPPQPVSPEAPAALDAAPAGEPSIVPAATDAAPDGADAPLDATPPPDVAVVADSAPLAPQSPISPATPAAGDATPDRRIAVSDPETGVPDDEDTEVVSLVQAPAVSVLPGGTGNVRVNRLTGGGSTIAPRSEAVPDVAEEETPASDDGETDQTAFQRYAVAAENPDGLPEIAIVLIDNSDFNGAVAAIKGIGFPVSVMINPSAQNATSRMKSYRAAGIEVGLLATLPPAATAADVAVFYEAALDVLPETAVALDVVTDTQAEPEVLRQTVTALAEEGRGLITVPSGLNTAERVAADSGVPSGAIYRFLDENDQDARVIQRFLDQAAFRARQTSGVILLGQVRGETIVALTQWGAANRAGQVAVVPVTAIMATPE